MAPIVKKPAAKKKIIVKRPARPPQTKTAAKPPVKRTAKTAAGMKAGAARKAPPSTKPAPSKPIEAPSIEGRTNQDIINVVYRAAEDLRMPPWSLMSKAKLEHLVEARAAAYTGPSIGDLPNLTPDEKAVIAKTLAGYVRPKK